MKTAEEIINESCKPYGGFVNVITKCGGSAVAMIWKIAMESYYKERSSKDAELTERLKEALEDAEIQIEYLHEKFKVTGTGNNILTRIDAALTAYKEAKQSRGY